MSRLHLGLLLLLLISPSTSKRLKCSGSHAADSGLCKANACPKSKSRNSTVLQVSNDYEPRFDQMLALRIIGGACVTQQEITEAYLKLMYIYSCIFPIIHDNSIKDLNSNSSIRLGEILELDQTMQMKGRVYLHSKEENDPELITRKIDDFIKHLLERNEYKKYRKFPNPKGTWKSTTMEGTGMDESTTPS